MAIYHFSVKTMSRSNGRSAVACAAYRSGEKLVCDFYGKEQDYTKKTGVEFTEIYAPDNTNTELLNRQILWNEVEKVERRKDALLAREFEIAFPSELNAEQRKNMLNELCQSLVKKHGVIVDAAIHAPHTDGGSDERNYHAHVMFTTRAIDLETGNFAAKKYRDFSRDNGTETVSEWRKEFAELVNSKLEQIGSIERVSHLSYKDLKCDREATKHEGVAVTALRRQHEREQEKPFNERNQEIVLPQLAQQNDEIKLRNLNLEIIATENLIKSLKKESKPSFDDLLLASTKELSSSSFDDLLQESRPKEQGSDIFASLNSSISSLGKAELFSNLNSSIENQAELEAKQRQAELEAKQRQAELEAKQRQAELEAKQRQAEWIAPKPRGDDFSPF